MTAHGFPLEVAPAVLGPVRAHGMVVRAAGGVEDWVPVRCGLPAEAVVAVWHGLRLADGYLVGVVPCTEPAVVAGPDGAPGGGGTPDSSPPRQARGGRGRGGVGRRRPAADAGTVADGRRGDAA